MSGILSLSTSCIFDFWMKTSKTTIMATVKISKKTGKWTFQLPQGTGQ